MIFSGSRFRATSFILSSHAQAHATDYGWSICISTCVVNHFLLGLAARSRLRVFGFSSAIEAKSSSSGLVGPPRVLALLVRGWSRGGSSSQWKFVVPIVAKTLITSLPSMYPAGRLARRGIISVEYPASLLRGWKTSPRTVNNNTIYQFRFRFVNFCSN